MALLTEEKMNKPSIWNQALKAVKGDSMNEMVEQFTQEMTLVAEGLCEDQARLRRAVDGLLKEAQRTGLSGAGAPACRASERNKDQAGRACTAHIRTGKAR